MNTSALIPLIATIAYIPLFVVLLSNRPWQQRHTLFLLFLISAALWSFTTFLSMGGWSPQSKEVDVRIVVCIAILTMVQFHYFVRSFYQSQRIKMPLAYIFLVATIVLVAVPSIPDYLKPVVTYSGVNYGYGIIAIYVLFLSTVGIKDIYSLLQKHRLSPNPAERNQIVYLFASIVIFTVFLLGGIRGGEFPIYHIGNLVVACVLTYAVVTHRLGDVRVTARRALIYVVLYGGGFAIVLALVWVALRQSGHTSVFPLLAVIIGLGIPAIMFLVHKVRVLWQKKVE